MPLDLIAAIIGVGAIIAVGVWYWEIRTRRASRLPFSDRPSMSSDELHRAFYAGSDVSKAQMETGLGEIARALGVPAGRLRPSDRFDAELAPEEGWEFDDGLGRLTAVAEGKLIERGLNREWVVRIKTVDDYVRLATTDPVDPFR
jgi:hypothetical protein